MKYQEEFYIEKEGEEKEVIRLYDLNQELVVDHNNDPENIQLIDMTNGEVLAKFRYGDGHIEGFSFAVSPRHNYLIVKEVQYGQSLDDLYATIYCLKDKEKFEPRSPSQFGPLRKQLFHSYYHLNFLFSNEPEEHTVWLVGQEVSNLNTIDVYQYGDYEVSSRDKNVREALFYPSATYPLVELDKRIRDRIGSLTFNEREVVNSLEKIEREQHRKFCGIKIDYDFYKVISGLLKEKTTTDDLYLNHTLFTSSKYKSDFKSLQRKLDTFGLECRILESKKNDHEYQYIVISTPLVNVSSMIAQSIAQVSLICEEFGVLYEGFTFSQKIKLENWDDAITSSLGCYRFLCCAVGEKSLALDSFIPLFHQIKRKHDKTDFDLFYADEDYQALENVEVGLSRFDDWDIKEDELREHLEQVITSLDQVF